MEIIQTLGGVFNRILIRYPNRIKQWLFGKRVPIAFLEEGGVRVCGDAVLRYFWFGFAVIFILTRGIAVSKH